MIMELMDLFRNSSTAEIQLAQEWLAGKTQKDIVMIERLVKEAYHAGYETGSAAGYESATTNKSEKP